MSNEENFPKRKFISVNFEVGQHQSSTSFRDEILWSNNQAVQFRLQLLFCSTPFPSQYYDEVAKV